MVYKRLNWGEHEPIFSSKLNDMVGNDDWIYQNMITGFYDVLGIARDSGLSMRIGHVKGVASESGSFFASHYYKKPFLPGARAIVITSVISAAAMRMLVGVKGLDNRAIPDHRGFLLHFSQIRASGEGTKFYGDYNAGYVALAPNG